MAVFTRFSGGFCILLLCVAPAAPPPLWAVPGPPVHEKRTPTAADAHDLKIVVKLRAVPTSKVPFPVEIAGFPDFSRPVPVYPAFLKYVVPVQSDCCISIARRVLEILLFQLLLFFFVFLNINSLNLEDNGACTVIVAGKAAKKHSGNLTHPIQKDVL